MELEGIGTIKQGTDGQTAWESSSLQGPRIKQGEERAVALREATLRGPLYWRKLYKHVETMSQETIDDQACYKVVLTPEEGKPDTQYYEQEERPDGEDGFGSDQSHGRDSDRDDTERI